MPFKPEQFRSAHLSARTMEVRVEELQDWFDGEPLWKVRAPSANDLARANDAQARLSRVSALAQALTDGGKAEILREMQAVIGRSDDVMPDVARRLELVAACSIDPECDLELAVKLAEFAPVAFYSISNAILLLAGKGPEIEKKPIGSGGTNTSGPPSR
jgi:hypothetical protein